ncbi:YfzA family protein [Bacillus wiedmannii]|uniref:YfzA family protein n=1 Tax=Bacillus wiedmannii TaxID=1890302 RepID=UPI00094AF0B6|nr:YfzA family protein [Bacillus wiedmannii]MBZ4222765.1 YfzA family protein [Bacillus wiedmannii]
MEHELNKEQPIWKRTWFRYLGAFIIVQLLFIICEVTGWAPNFKPSGEFLNRILHSEFFTEWFTPYEIPHFNVFTAFFAITLLPYALIGAMNDVTTRKNINN